MHNVESAWYVWGMWIGKGVQAVQDLVPNQETLEEELLSDLKPMTPGRLC
jgi:hypothetical protein